MDSSLRELIANNTPKINPVIADGIAIVHMQEAENYINSILTHVSKDFPAGLEYVGCRRCTPEEEFKIVTMKKNNRRQLDIARSDLYLMKYIFRYKGIELPPRHIFLPFVGVAGTIVLSGSRYTISPVLTDEVISIGIKEVFVRLLRAKLRFHRTPQSVMVNGVRENVQVVYSEVYNKSTAMKKQKSPVKAFTIIAHYLFCKYGVTDTFKMFAGTTPVIGENDININNYPEDQWVIFSSIQIAPKGAARGFYEPSKVRVAIRRDQCSPMVKSLIAGLFYVIDFFPSRMLSEYIDNIRLWKILLGLILFSDQVSEGKLHDDVQKHFSSLDEYIDNIVALQLKDIGYPCENIYQLFAVIINNFNEWLLKAPDNVNSMYDKKLSILYDVLYDITSSIFDMLFKLKAVSKKELLDKEIVNIMNSTLRVRSIFAITRQKKGVSIISYSGDNAFFKFTCVLVPQTSTGGRTSKKDRISVDDPQMQLHASVAEVGSFLSLPKPNPSGHARINPHLRLDANGVVMRDPNKVAIIDAIQDIIRR